jgi:serine/threonine-protein kinase HipA
VLLHFGKDCAGAVSCLPLDAPPIKRPGDLGTDYDTISETDLTEIVTALARRQPVGGDYVDASPVAGYQPKISIAIDQNSGFSRYLLPKKGSGAPTTHILKVPHGRNERDARAEVTATDLASRCGIKVPRTIALDFAGTWCVLSERFDRVVADGRVSRLHQEDFCQALGLPRSLKYERYGSVGRMFSAKAVGPLLGKTDLPVRSRQDFLRATLFNILVGNCDGHGKNYALFYPKGETPHLAPFYDIFPSRIDRGFTDAFPFSIGKAGDLNSVHGNDLSALVIDIGLPGKGAAKLVERLLTDMLPITERFRREFDGPFRKPWIDVIGQASHKLADALGLDSSWIADYDLPG